LNTSRECQILDCHREWKTEGAGRKRKPKERWSVPNYAVKDEDTGDIDITANLVLDEGKLSTVGKYLNARMNEIN